MTNVEVTEMPRFLSGVSFCCNAFMTITTTSKGDSEGWGVVRERSLAAEPDNKPDTARNPTNQQNLIILSKLISLPYIHFLCPQHWSLSDLRLIVRLISYRSTWLLFVPIARVFVT